MKAAFLTGFGGNEVVSYGDVPEPVRGEDAVLVEVHAAGVNPVEVVIRQGLFPSLPPTFPLVMGFDISFPPDSGSSDNICKSSLRLVHDGDVNRFVELNAVK